MAAARSTVVQDVSPFPPTPVYALLKKMQPRKLLTFLPLVLILASCSRDPKVQAQRYVDNGNKFFAKAKYKEAGIMYRRALQKDARFGEAYYRLGLDDLKLGAYGDAVRSLRNAVELQPTNLDAITKISDLLLVAASQDAGHRKTLLNDAHDMSDKLIKLNPQSFDGHRIRGQIALLSGDPKEAITEFEQANAAKPYQPELTVNYFQALAANGQFPEAEKLGKELISREKNYSPMYDLMYLSYMRLKRLADAEEILKLKVANNPQRANYQLQLVQFYFLTNRRPEMDAVVETMTDEKKFPEGHLLVGDFFLFRAHEFDRAERQYEAAMKAFPKDKAMYQKRLVELYGTTGKNQEANTLLATILKDNPKDNDAIAMRAAMMLTTGNRDQINTAANDLQALVTKMPQNHLLRFNLARAMVAKGDLEAARLQLEEAIKLRTDFVAAREMLARIYLVKNDPNKALKAADELIALDPHNLPGHLVRSNSLLAIGDKDRAREELDLIEKTFPQNVEARFQVGYLAYQEKDYKKAEQIFTELHNTNPTDRRGLIGVTETLISENRINDAIKEMEKAVKAEPERRDLKLFLAQNYVRAERYDEAITIFRTLLEKEPKSAELLMRLAETERRKGDLNLAIDGFRHCSQEAPSDTLCLLRLAQLLEGTGKSDQAKPIYEQILKIQPDHAIALNNLAYAKAQEGVDLDQALTMAQRAVQKAPGSLDMKDTLGWVYIKKNLSDDAVGVYKDLVKKDPNNAIFHYHFGMALLQKGDKPSAKDELEKALKDNPSRDDAGKIRELLQKI